MKEKEKLAKDIDDLKEQLGLDIYKTMKLKFMQESLEIQQERLAVAKAYLDCFRRAHGIKTNE